MTREFYAFMLGFGVTSLCILIGMILNGLRK